MLNSNKNVEKEGFSLLLNEQGFSLINENKVIKENIDRKKHSLKNREQDIKTTLCFRLHACIIQ